MYLKDIHVILSSPRCCDPTIAISAKLFNPKTQKSLQGRSFLFETGLKNWKGIFIQPFIEEKTVMTRNKRQVATSDVSTPTWPCGGAPVQSERIYLSQQNG